LVQGASYVYNFDPRWFDQAQFDLLWTAGLAYRF
jgi:hypothetical protein